MKDYLKKIDTQTSGNRYDVTPLLSDPDCFRQLIDELIEPFKNSQIDYVACIDALGFILGTAVAQKFGVGILPIRKGGKLPVEVLSENLIDYSGREKSLEIRPDILCPGNKVLLVDEWIETGSQVKVAIELIEKQKCEVVGILTINMDENEKTRNLKKKYFVHQVWEED